MPIMRALPAVVALAAIAALGACKRTPSVSAAAGGATPTPAGASLWRIDAINDGKVVRTVRICADAAVKSGFSRPAPEYQGQPCERLRASGSGDAYAVVCQMNHVNYVVSATRRGDPERDFTVDMSVAPQGGAGPTFEQSRRYVKLGPCPAGWVIGDTAAPGDRKVSNALAANAPRAPAP